MSSVPFNTGSADVVVRPMLIGINGYRYSGKDSVARIITELFPGRAASISFGDPLKRACRDIYDFTEEQLWGDLKEQVDERYPRSQHAPRVIYNEATDYPVRIQCDCCSAEYVLAEGEYLAPRSAMQRTGQCFLTPRYAMQRLGTEGVRDCYHNMWLDKALRDANRLLTEPNLAYNRTTGVFSDSDRAVHPEDKSRNVVTTAGCCSVVVIPDVRFRNELDGMRDAHKFVAKAVDIKLIRVKRPGFDTPQFGHASEQEQSQIPDAAFDVVIYNDLEGLHALEQKARQALDVLRGKIRAYDDTQRDIPPFKRK